MVDLEGFEPCIIVDSTQLIDSTKQQKRQKRSKRQFQVRGGYTDCCAGAVGVRKIVEWKSGHHRYEGRSLQAWHDPEPTLLVGRGFLTVMQGTALAFRKARLSGESRRLEDLVMAMVRPVTEDQRQGHKFPACLYRATRGENHPGQALPRDRGILSAGYP